MRCGFFLAVSGLGIWLRRAGFISCMHEEEESPCFRVRQEPLDQLSCRLRSSLGKNGGEFKMYFRAAYTKFIHSGLLDEASVRLIIK